MFRQFRQYKKTRKLYSIETIIMLKFMLSFHVIPWQLNWLQILVNSNKISRYENKYCLAPRSYLVQIMQYNEAALSDFTIPCHAGCWYVVWSSTNKGHAFTFAAWALFRSYRNRFHGQIAKSSACAGKPSTLLQRWRSGRARGRGGPLSPGEAARASTPVALLRWPTMN